jgi:hypothetical protein
MKRRRIGVILCLAAIGAAPFAVSSRAQELVLAGDAEARIVTFDIGAGGISLPSGISRASLAGTEASATANFVDYALIATLLGAIDPAAALPVPLPVDFGFPPPLKATSTGTRDAERDARAPILGALPSLRGGPVRIATGREEVHATPDPSARALVDLGGVRIEGVSDSGGGRSTASVDVSSVVATSTYGGIDIAGQVQLRGLEWRAEQLADGTARASFGVGGIVVGGQRMPVETGEQRRAAIEAANTALEPLGVRLDEPNVESGASGGRVGPLVIALTKSDVRRATIGELYAALSPVLIQTFNRIQEQVPEAGYLLFGANIVLATLAGIADFEVELGGVSASLGQTDIAAPDAGGDGGDGGLLPVPGGSDTPSGDLPGLDLGPLPLPGPAPITPFGDAPAPAPAAPALPSGDTVVPAAASDEADSRWVLLLAALAVGGLSLVVAGDPREETQQEDAHA